MGTQGPGSQEGFLEEGTAEVGCCSVADRSGTSLGAERPTLPKGRGQTWRQYVFKNKIPNGAGQRALCPLTALSLLTCPHTALLSILPGGFDLQFPGAQFTHPGSDRTKIWVWVCMSAKSLLPCVILGLNQGLCMTLAPGQSFCSAIG